MHVASTMAAGVAGAEPVLARKLARLLGQVPPERQAGGVDRAGFHAMDAAPWQALLRHLPGSSPDVEAERIKVIRAGVGNTVHMIPVAAVVCFEAIEKYVNVVTPTCEALVRLSLRELMARIDSTDFIQVHRGVLVNSHAILSATRDELGHYSLCVRGLQRPLKVSRAFAHLFRPM
ncbi:MAG: LytTR family DNA-binding domain-containing protein [Rubrivivax sp.]|nr:LytTR family DNA-binding domain-containing protein [Rubrivivax sp.]